MSPGDSAITFNVVFLRGSVARLLPFAQSLLKGSGVRVRLVANHCGPDEVELLRAAADADERVSFHTLRVGYPIEYGLALNELFETFTDPHFAIADSDVLASGDFMHGLWHEPRPNAVCSAPPVWLAEEETVADPGVRFLSGRVRFLSDGTHIGSSWVAIYERAAIEPLWRRLPRGFAFHQRYLLPRDLREALSERGWRFRMYDTCRLLNFELIRAGGTLEHRLVPELHHVGSFSARPIEGMGPLARGFARLIWSRDRVPTRIANIIALRLHARSQRRDPEFLRMDARRRTVRAHVSAVLDALAADEPPPPAPRTDSPEVDARVAALVEAIEAQHPPVGRPA
jgi:hypothetical protein